MSLEYDDSIKSEKQKLSIEKFIELIAQNCAINSKNINSDSRIADLDMNSIELSLLILLLEENFQNISLENINSLEASITESRATIQELFDFLKSE